MSEYDTPKIIVVVVIATFLLVGFGTLIVCAFIDITTGHDIKVEESCIDKFGHEFKDELCINKIHCGNLYARFDKRCDVLVSGDEQDE